MPEMKTVVFSERSRARVLHIEAPGCIVNIRKGLTNMQGQDVTSVEIVCDEYADEPKRYIADIPSIEDIAEAIAHNYVIFDTMSKKEIADWLTDYFSTYAKHGSINVRVVREREAVKA